MFDMGSADDYASQCASLEREVADLNSQVRALQKENNTLRNLAQPVPPIWVATGGFNWEGDRILGVFSSIEEGKEFVQSFPSLGYDRFSVVEMLGTKRIQEHSWHRGKAGVWAVKVLRFD